MTALALAALFCGIGFLFGLVYPLAAIIIYRLAGSKKSIRQILREI